MTQAISRFCPVCERDGLQDDIFCLNTSFLRCPGCGLGKTGVMRSASEWRSENDAFYNSSQVDAYVERVQTTAQAMRSLDTAKWILSRSGCYGAGTYLDVGCSSGSMLLAFEKLGWNVFGVEPTDSVRAVPDDLRGSVQQCSFGDESFTGPFRLITAFHVLEHIPDPFGFVSRCRDLLEPHAVLVIEVPDFEYARRLIKQHGANIEQNLVSHLSPNFHVHHFGVQSLSKLVSKTGLRVRWCGYTSPVPRPIPPATAIQMRERDRPGVSQQKVSNRSFISPRLAAAKIKDLLWRSAWVRIHARDFLANRMGLGCNVAIIASRSS